MEFETASKRWAWLLEEAVNVDTWALRQPLWLVSQPSVADSYKMLLRRRCESQKGLGEKPENSLQLCE